MRNLFLMLVFLFVLAIPILAFAQTGDMTSSLMQPIYDYVMTHAWAKYVITTFMVVKFVTQFIPSTLQGRWYYNYPMKLVNFFLMNNGKNKNADDAPLKESNKIMV